MKKLGITLVLLGTIGMAIITLEFAANIHPIWMRSVKRLPEKPAFTVNEVAAVLRDQVDQTRARLLFGMGFAVVAIAGNSILAIGSGRTR